MKRLATALALCASAPLTPAQSSVSLSGGLDMGAGRIFSTGKPAVNGLVSGGNTVGRLTFRGTEDLGGGLSAGFYLEGELQSDTGNPGGFNFLRRSTVSLSGPLGEMRLGRDFVPTDVSSIAFDAFSQRGMGTVELAGAAAPTAQGGGFVSNAAAFSYVRASNSVAYFLPATLGGVYGTLQYAFAEQDSSAPVTALTSRHQGQSAGARFGYARGSLNVALAAALFSDVARSARYVGDYKVVNLGGAYDFGVLKTFAYFQNESMARGASALPAFRYQSYAVGAHIPFGVQLIRLSVSRYDNKTPGSLQRDAIKISAGYDYAVSKRTSAYAVVARIDNKGGPADGGTLAIGGISGSLVAPVPIAGGKSTGLTVGVKHLF